MLNVAAVYDRRTFTSVILSLSKDQFRFLMKAL